MKSRRVHGFGFFVVMTVLLSAGTALAAPASPKATSSGRVPQVSVSWRFGPSSPFGGTRFDGELYTPTNRVYFLGFRTFADATDGSIWYFDVATRTYVDTGKDMLVPVSNYQIAALTDSTGLGFYIFGGRDSLAQIVKNVQVYYPATGMTKDVTTDPWPGTTPPGCVSLPGNGVAVIANRAFVMGGLSTSANGCQDSQSAQTWIFNPMAPAGSRWSAGPNLNVARAYVTPAILNGRIYAIGGDTNVGGTLFAQPTVEAWKPPAGGWNDAAVTDLPAPGCEESQAFPFTAGPLANGIVLAGCGQWPNATPDTNFYSATSNTWSAVGALNEPRRNQAGFLLGTRMFVLGGYDCPGNACGVDPTVTSESGRGSASAARPGFARPLPRGGSNSGKASTT